MNNNFKILLIGGPATGKSSVLNLLKKEGYPVFPEISRSVTLEAQKQGVSQLFLSDPLLFSRKLLEGRVKQYEQAQQSSETVFIDRGIPDITAYLDYKNDDYPEEFDEANENYRYDLIFLFPVWQDIYESDNERYESFEEAETIQKYIEESYENLGYNSIVMPKTTVKERVKFILTQSGIE